MVDEPGFLQPDDEPINLVYFFITLAEPLPLPHHFVQKFYEYPAFDDFLIAMEADRRISLNAPKRLASLMFWQTTVPDYDLFGFGAAAEVAAKAFPGSTQGTGNQNPFRNQGRWLRLRSSSLPLMGKQ